MTLWHCINGGNLASYRTRGLFQRPAKPTCDRTGSSPDPDRTPVSPVHEVTYVTR